MGAYVKAVVQLLIAVAFGILIFGAIAKKAGYSRWLGFTMLVPVLNIGVLVWFALTEWPIETALTRLRHGEPEATKAIWLEPM